MTVLALLLSIDIYSFHINSTVTSRYATTIITSRVTNVLNQSQEVHFEVKIPKDAFISQFRMTIEGKLYDGVVKEKEEAQQQYSVFQIHSSLAPTLIKFTYLFEFLKKLSKVVYHSSGPTVDLSSGRPEHENFIKRLWAFLTVKQLLEKMVFLKGLEKDNAKKDTLDLSLKYKFVTPLTSMLVSPRMRKCKLPTNPRRERSQKGIHPEVIRYVRSNKEKELKDIYLFIRIIFMIFSLVSIRTSFEKIKNSYQPQTFQSYAFICWKVVFFILLAYSRFIPTTIFLWPAIWQQPKDVGLMDILGEAGISYYEIPGSQTPTLKIKDKEVKTSWVMVKDYRLASAPVVGCWLVPFQAVTQQELSDLTITQLYNSAKQQQKRLSIIVLTFPIITYSLYVHC
uniref:Inter-alpha-trypsin inhibitor heavy chain 3b n=1 Tax=Cyprinus carpio TaxID=7962 RepID=A0A8C1RCP0_CYPCA